MVHGPSIRRLLRVNPKRVLLGVGILVSDLLRDLLRLLDLSLLYRLGLIMKPSICITTNRAEQQTTNQQKV